MGEAQVLNKTRPYDKETDSSHQYTQHWSNQKEDSSESKIECAYEHGIECFLRHLVFVRVRIVKKSLNVQRDVIYTHE
jgi:hypothetical protein